MAVNLTDPEGTMAAYESVVQGQLSWLLLGYENNEFDHLSLVAQGSLGLPELKSKVDDLDRVFICLYREVEVGNPGFILINYIPHSASAVRRARSLVHSRRIGALFTAHQTTLTIDALSNLTTTAIRNALADPSTPHVIQMGRAMSQDSDNLRKALPNLNPVIEEQVRRSVSESYSYSPPPPSLQAMKGNSLFSHFLRRKKKLDDGHDLRLDEKQDDPFDDVPPPAPPKDKGKFSVQQPHQFHMSTQALVGHVPDVSQDNLRRSRANSLTDFTIIPRPYSPDEVIVEPFSPAIVETQAPQRAVSQSLPHRGKWSPVTTFTADPAERARRRAEAQRQREIEDEEAIRAERKRQTRLKLQKQRIMEQEMEEDERRRASLEDELRRITAERRRRDQLEKEMEEKRLQEIETRKRVDRQRRLEEHRKWDEWRKEQARLASEAEKRAEEARRQEEAERKKRIRQIEAKVKSNTQAESLFTGWVTLQMNDSLVWKRRFFKFSGNTLFFYRSPKDTNLVLDKVALRGQLRALKEWNEGYEELEAIPHSFAVEFKDSRAPWSMFADSEEEKVKLLGLLHHAAGL